MKETITRLVTLYNGIKAVDLALKVMEEVNPSKFDHNEYIKELNELIGSGEIRQIVYFTTGASLFDKKIYFSRDTVFVSSFMRGANEQSSQIELDRTSKGDT